MDYILVIVLSWIVLELISNICLKQSTFKVTFKIHIEHTRVDFILIYLFYFILLQYAPHKIYVWLTIYYTNILFMILHATYIIIMIIWNPSTLNMYSFVYRTDEISHLISVRYINNNIDHKNIVFKLC